MIEWSNYRNCNTGELLDCQLVSFFNAHYCLTGELISEEEYARLLESTRANDGAPCDNIDDVYGRYGLKRSLGGKSLVDKDENLFGPKLPFELSVYHKRYENHSVLVVDYEPITKSIRVTNFGCETNTEGWMYLEDMFHFSQNIRVKGGAARYYQIGHTFCGSIKKYIKSVGA